MIRNLRRFVLFLTLSFAFINTPVFSAPLISYHDVYNISVKSISALPAALNSVIHDLETKNSDIHKIIVYRFQNYYVLYVLSSKYWKVTKMRVDTNTMGEVTRIIDSYKGTEEEYKALSAYDEGLSLSEFKTKPKFLCPDPSVEFVAMSSVPDMGTVKESIEAVYQAASQKYKTVKILGEKADAKAYKSWLSCSNLKGFYSIGHGNSEEIVAANDGIVSYRFFRFNLDFKYQNSHTILALNSCEVFNDPLGTIINFGDARSLSQYKRAPGPLPGVFLGGYTDLMVGASENVSSCFIIKKLAGSPANYQTLKNCVGDLDFYYKGFGLTHPGEYYPPAFP